MFAITMMIFSLNILINNHLSHIDSIGGIYIVGHSLNFTVEGGNDKLRIIKFFNLQSLDNMLHFLAVRGCIT